MYFGLTAMRVPEKDHERDQHRLENKDFVLMVAIVIGPCWKSVAHCPPIHDFFPYWIGLSRRVC